MENLIEKLSEQQMLYLLWVTIMNQSQKSSEVIKNVKLLIERIGNKEYNNLTYNEIACIINSTPKLHRFPNMMSKYIYDSILTINNVFLGNIKNVFSYETVYNNLLIFKGISEHKAEMCLGVIYCLVNNCIELGIFRGCNLSEEVLMDELDIINSLV